MDIFSLILETKNEMARGSAEGRNKMLTAPKRAHGNPTKSRVKIYASIMDALRKGYVGQMFSTPEADRIYVITLQKWGDSEEQVYSGRIAKGFNNFADAKKFGARTLVRHGKSTSSNLKKYFKSKRKD